MRPFLVSLCVVAALTLAGGAAATAEICEGFGPQTPRDIDFRGGENPRSFSPAPPAGELNLCNIHFHAQAEHRGRDFSLVTDGKPGFQCNARQTLTEAELAPVGAEAQKRCGGVEPGDTVEVHWVYSSCDVAPGQGLGSCLSDACANPDLRVETQVFLLVNDPEAMNFADLAYDGNMAGAYHQPKALPASTGAPVEFLGSTTGPSYTDEVCSPLQVTWSVRPYCAKLDISSLDAWCGDNVFGEKAAHGVRELVTDPRLLSAIR